MKIMFPTTKTLCLALAFLYAAASFGQSFRAELNSPKESGLYKILLPAKLRAASAQNFDYLRLKNAQGQELPYLIMDATDREYASYESLEILRQEILPDSISSYIIARKNGLNSNLSLKIANTTINKSISIYGSENQKEWFGLVENQKMNLSAASSPLIDYGLALPLNTYPYLKLIIDNRTSAPIDLKEIGFYANQYVSSEALPLDGIKWEVEEMKVEKITRIHFSSLDSHQIDAIAFDINSAYYLRDASLIQSRMRQIRKKREIYEEELYRFKLSSRSQNYLTFDDLALQNFRIDIDNQDNPPLDISSIHFYQKPKYLVAFMETGSSYFIDVDKGRNKPKYDLGNFISDKLAGLQEAEISSMGELKANADQTKASASESFFQSKLFMWLAIILGGLLITYIAFGLLRDMGKE